MTWQTFLQLHGGGPHPRYKPARDWLRAGLTWAQALATCERGDWLLWAALEMELITPDVAMSCACQCVDRLDALAPEILSVTAELRRAVTATNPRARERAIIEAHHEAFGMYCYAAEMESKGEEPATE